MNWRGMTKMRFMADIMAILPTLSNRAQREAEPFAQEGERPGHSLRKAKGRTIR